MSASRELRDAACVRPLGAENRDPAFLAGGEIYRIHARARCG